MQVYSDPKRASLPHALPNVEVFYLHAGPRKAYDRAYAMDFCEEHVDPCDCLAKGWYWWGCLPGCLPDGGLNGPFDSAAAATADAQEE